MKKNSIYFKYFLGFLLLLNTLYLNSQNIVINDNVKIFNEQSINKLNKHIKLNIGNGTLLFNENNNINPETFFIQYKEDFLLSDFDEMKLSNVTNDNENIYYHYQQYYKGVKIVGAEYLLQTKKNDLFSSNGKIINNLFLDVNATMSRDNIENLILDTLNKIISNNISKEDLSKKNVELLIIRNNNESILNYDLTYKYEIEKLNIIIYFDLHYAVPQI